MKRRMTMKLGDYPRMYKIVDASPNLLQHLGNGLYLDRAVDLVAEADVNRGAAGFSLARMQVVQLPGPRCRSPYRCFFPEGREGRPVNTGDGDTPDPLSPESVAARGQSYFHVQVGSFLLQLLRNPYGYSGRCSTWPTVEMVEQSAAGLNRGLWRRVLEAMLLLCRALSRDMVAFNALAGNTMKRLHLVSHQPPPGLGPYALQGVAAQLGDAARRDVVRIGSREGYPIDAWRFGLEDPEDCAVQAAGLVSRWHDVGGPFATASVAAVMEDDRAVLYVTPRHRLLSPFGWPGMPAVMEVMGVGVSSQPEMVARVRSGAWGHADFERLLASLRPHGVEFLG
jgi:hypothetical protein